MKKIVVLVTLLSGLLLANPFAAGNKGIGITVGTGSVTYSSGPWGLSSSVENYYIVGLSGEFFVVDNLSLGLGYRGWFGGTPTINQATIPLTYYVPTGSKFRPYLGAFYRYTYISDDNYDNYSSAGGRAGLAILFQNGYAGFGWVQEVYLDRNSGDSSFGYPEVTIGFSF